MTRVANRRAYQGQQRPVQLKGASDFSCLGRARLPVGGSTWSGSSSFQGRAHEDPDGLRLFPENDRNDVHHGVKVAFDQANAGNGSSSSTRALNLVFLPEIWPCRSRRRRRRRSGASPGSTVCIRAPAQGSLLCAAVDNLDF
jgi:hypothetical protein